MTETQYLSSSDPAAILTFLRERTDAKEYERRCRGGDAIRKTQ